MAELILTEEEKATASVLNLSDDALGKWTRKMFFDILRVQRKGLAEKHLGLQCAALFYLIHANVESNAQHARYDLARPTYKGEANIGDWEVVVRRKHPLGTRLRTFFRDLRDRIQRRESLVTSTSAEGIHLKWTAADGRDKTPQILKPKDHLH